jgi:acetate kinase
VDAEPGNEHADIQRLLYTESGLLGLSGISGDVRELLASTEPQAKLALDLFAYRCAEKLAGLAVPLGGIDALVFTAGIGENQPAIRAAICAHLGWLGVRLDDASNQAGAAVISTAESRVQVLIEPTSEEWMIARKTVALLTDR